MNFLSSPLVRGWPQRLWWWRIRGKLGACGHSVHLPRNGSYVGLKNLFFGNNIFFGERAMLWATRSRIQIGNNVISGPEVVMLGGDHNEALLSKFMINVLDDEKLPQHDRDIVVEGDCWIGARSIVLRGVIIGRGAVIGAGAIVTKSVPPYCIVAGNPARPLRLRGTVSEILAHEQALYPPEERLSAQALEAAADLTQRDLLRSSRLVVS